MYKIKKRLEIAGSHYLRLPYESKCSSIHGHNWIIELEFKGMELNKSGMLIDFSDVKKIINEKFDHKNLNDIPSFTKINPTAENIAKYLFDYFPNCYRLTVIESENNTAIYEKD